MDAGDRNAAVVGSAEARSSGRPRGCVFVTCCERTGSQSGVAGGHTSGSPWELVRRAVSCPHPRPTESESLVWQQAICVSLSFLMSGGPAGLPESSVQETSEGVRGWVSAGVCGPVIPDPPGFPLFHHPFCSLPLSLSQTQEVLSAGEVGTFLSQIHHFCKCPTCLERRAFEAGKPEFCNAQHEALKSEGSSVLFCNPFLS